MPELLCIPQKSSIVATQMITIMNDLIVILRKIYEIRNQRVMLDFELAELYGVETAQLKRAVRRNIERFEGEDFMIVLNKEEIQALGSRCQIGILNSGEVKDYACVCGVETTDTDGERIVSGVAARDI